jgi:hypothetical protein
MIDLEHKRKLSNNKQLLNDRLWMKLVEVKNSHRNIYNKHLRSRRNFSFLVLKFLFRVRTEKRNEEEASRTETERKIKSLLNLRNAIERNKV